MGFLHPEVKKDVYEEFARLTKRFPFLSSETKLSLAKSAVKTLCEAKTNVFMKVHCYV